MMYMTSYSDFIRFARLFSWNPPSTKVSQKKESSKYQSYSQMQSYSSLQELPELRGAVC